jgi:hypothetical protein
MNDQPDELEPHDIFAIEEGEELFGQCPVNYKIIHQNQQQDQALKQLLQQSGINID